MLVHTDRNSFLPAEEALLKYRQEKIEPIHDTYRLSDHEDLANLHKRRGFSLHSSELIHRIQKLNPRIFVETQINYPDQWGFYMDVKGQRTYVSGFNKGWLREFSAIQVDDNNLQTGDEIRGWRTVLLRLMSLGVITWEQVIQAFGECEGVNSRRWAQHTAIFRNQCATQKIMANLA